jgi:hypothetical protein
MFRLDYLSCFLTVVATILVGRKMWSGLVVSGVNSLIVCVIGLHTSQYGFIPANVFCICINAYNLRAWLSSGMVKGGGRSESTTDASGELVAGCKRVSTSRKAATRRLIKSFRIRSEGRRGNSISFLAVKGVWPFAPTPFALTQTSGCPTLDAVSSRQEWKSAISTVLSRFPSHQSYFRIADNPGSGGLQSGRLELLLSEMALSTTIDHENPAWATRLMDLDRIAAGDSE